MSKIVLEYIDFSTILPADRPAFGKTIIGIDTDGKVKRMDHNGVIVVVEQPSPIVFPPYVHTQSTPSTIWNVAHNRGKIPGVTIQDNSGNDWDGSITYTDQNNLTIEFSLALSGHAYID